MPPQASSTDGPYDLPTSTHLLHPKYAKRRRDLLEVLQQPRALGGAGWSPRRARLNYRKITMAICITLRRWQLRQRKTHKLDYYLERILNKIRRINFKHKGHHVPGSRRGSSLLNAAVFHMLVCHLLWHRAEVSRTYHPHYSPFKGDLQHALSEAPKDSGPTVSEYIEFCKRYPPSVYDFRIDGAGNGMVEGGFVVDANNTIKWSKLDAIEGEIEGALDFREFRPRPGQHSNEAGERSTAMWLGPQGEEEGAEEVGDESVGTVQIVHSPTILSVGEGVEDDSRGGKNKGLGVFGSVKRRISRLWHRG